MKTVLVIEDDILQQQIINNVLNQDYKTIIASSGMEGYRKALYCQPDLILLDICLPDITGLQVAEKIKSNYKIANIPIIFSSSEQNVSNNKYNHTFLAKPYTANKLLEYVGRLC